jgi:hypothetical protein
MTTNPLPLDGKFGIKDGRLVKMSNDEFVPPDEPLFIFRGRDHLAMQVIRFYYQLCVDDGCNDYQLDSITKQLEKFEKFAETHAERMKQPGITRGR